MSTADPDTQLEQAPPAIQPCCPWCHGPIQQTAERDKTMQGWLHIGRTYRCDLCRCRIIVDADPEPPT